MLNFAFEIKFPLFGSDYYFSVETSGMQTFAKKKVLMRPRRKWVIDSIENFRR